MEAEIYGKKSAILIGVSEYQNIPNFDACKRDVDIMHSIIEYFKYDDTLFIDTETDSYSEKKKLTNFFEKHQNEETDVDQIFFYFSGHGTVDRENFHYLLSNYSTYRLATSSLSNNEIDNLIRLLNPKLTVKFVDACKSGTVYIKNNDYSTIYSKAIPSESASLGSCYFMFSSLNDEPSKAQNLSYFTEAIASAIEEQEEDGRVRFTDIIDYVRDIFSEEGIYAGEQTP
ncbi:caspase family protein [Bacillus mycoides]